MEKILSIRKVFFIWILGFTSGFTLLLAGGTLNFWLASKHIDLKLIGLFSLTNLPYAVKFLWAPLLDKILAAKSKIMVLLIINFLLISNLLTLGSFSPNTNLLEIAVCSFVVSFFSASQDIVLGNLRINILKPKEHGPAGGIYNFGYRIGMVFSGSGAIYLSDLLSWRMIYSISGIILAIASFAISLFIVFLQKKEITRDSKNIFDITSKDTHHHGEEKTLNVKSLTILLIFLVWYRLADDMIVQMLNPLLLSLEYSNIDIATFGKLCGTIGTIIGSIIASNMMLRISISDALLYFGISHCLAHTLLIIQYLVGKNIMVLFVTTAVESITGGMSMAAYMALITASCYGKWRGTQYALFTSMMGCSRTLFPSFSGIIVSYLGWKIFLCLATIITVPSFILIQYLPHFKNKST